ncbi:hypothetical protein AOQ84DRAFT_22482 [Glonium stellatum]|uniref:Uncharacterized protein n=1 Tax=Glonium stellatum TaxID=574774 RepID=A0A8E2F350_9PEZI|nr:hypothetical protein AOQ84DRAFT_22482 [Glonium stellatum]
MLARPIGCVGRRCAARMENGLEGEARMHGWRRCEWCRGCVAGFWSGVGWRIGEGGAGSAARPGLGWRDGIYAGEPAGLGWDECCLSGFLADFDYCLQLPPWRRLSIYPHALRRTVL